MACFKCIGAPKPGNKARESWGLDQLWQIQERKKVPLRSANNF